MQAIGCAPHHARAHPVRNAARHPIRWPGESTAHRNRGCNRPRRIGEESERHRSDAIAGASRVRVRPASGCGAARSRELSWLRDPSRLNPCVSVADQPYHIPLSPLSQAKEKQGITPPERLQKPSPSRASRAFATLRPSFRRGKQSITPFLRKGEDKHNASRSFTPFGTKGVDAKRRGDAQPTLRARHRSITHLHAHRDQRLTAA